MLSYATNLIKNKRAWLPSTKIYKYRQYKLKNLIAKTVKDNKKSKFKDGTQRSYSKKSKIQASASKKE